VVANESKTKFYNVLDEIRVDQVDDNLNDFIHMLGVLTKASGVKIEGTLILSTEPENRWNGVGVQWNGTEYVRSDSNGHATNRT
jgi:hypothetical protein